MATIAENVRRLRAERGWSQEALAERAHIDRSYLAGIETGRRNPSVSKLVQVANALSVRLKELLES